MFQITLRAARVNKGYTLEYVAEIVGKTSKTIAKYEKDSTNIPRRLFVTLARLYGVPEEMIFCGKESDINGFARKTKVS
ncbi:helix-turn-helix domain-containing protein [Paenibacillus bouchesdurhonensis]|uniref:helix-turn-helix domain-containing protein n=1 Tax=Paenibacillus bouchesdurhonensis TaxID=1870990 RepID=UPI000DA61B26|nr:helix-turn-helix transcriptional regulator [Paenibacillus bouchesdurhonensis]